MLRAQRLDAAGKLILSLGQHHRRLIAAALVFEGDGVVRRVGDDHIGRRHGGEHLLLHEPAAHSLHRGLGLRVALGLLVLILHLLPRHHQVLVRLEFFVGVADRRHDPECEDDLGKKRQRGASQKLTEITRLDRADKNRVAHQRARADPEHEAERHELEHIDARLDQGVFGKHPPKAFDEIQVFELQPDRFGGHAKAALKTAHQQRGDHHTDHHRQKHATINADAFRQLHRQRIGAQRRGVEFAPDQRGHRRDLTRGGGQKKSNHTQHGCQRGDHLQLGRLRELSFLEGLAEALLGWHFCFGIFVGLGHRNPRQCKGDATRKTSLASCCIKTG